MRYHVASKELDKLVLLPALHMRAPLHYLELLLNSLKLVVDVVEEIGDVFKKDGLLELRAQLLHGHDGGGDVICHIDTMAAPLLKHIPHLIEDPICPSVLLGSTFIIVAIISKGVAIVCKRRHARLFIAGGGIVTVIPLTTIQLSPGILDYFTMVAQGPVACKHITRSGPLLGMRWLLAVRLLGGE